MFKGLGGEEEGGQSEEADPFMAACSQMFKDFEKVKKEGANPITPGGMPNLAGAGLPDMGEGEMQQLMKMMGAMLGGGPEGAGNPENMD